MQNKTNNTDKRNFLDVALHLINFRSFFVIALSIIASILCVYAMFFNFVIGAVLFVLLFVIIGVFAISARNNEEPLYKSVTYLVSIVAVIVVAINFVATILSYSYVDTDVSHSITGTIDSISDENDMIIIEDLTIDGSDESGKITIYLTFDDYDVLELVSVGDIISFSGKLYANLLIDDDLSISGTVYRTQIKYRCYSVSDLSYEKSAPSVVDIINAAIYEKLSLALGDDYASIAYAMICGDKTLISDNMMDYYSASGLIHILAISGLHIGFLAMLLLAFFKLIRIGRVKANIFTIMLLILYAIFVGASPSVVRAVIMSSIVMIAYILNERSDLLNSLSAAVAIILLFAPLYLFELGFLLSVGAVFGVVIFFKPIFAFLHKKLRFPRFLSNAIALSMAIQFGNVPILMGCFGCVQAYSFFVNILLIPFVSILYSVLVCTLLISFILGGSALIMLTLPFMTVLNSVVLLVAKLPYSSIYIASYLPIFVFAVVYLLYFLASRFILFPSTKVLMRVGYVEIVDKSQLNARRNSKFKNIMENNKVNNCDNVNNVNKFTKTAVIGGRQVNVKNDNDLEFAKVLVRRKITPRTKILRSFVALVICFAIAFCGIFIALNQNYNSYTAMVDSYCDITNIVYDGDKTYLVGDIGDYDAVYYMATSLNIVRFDAIIVNNLTDEVAEIVIDICNRFAVSAIYCYEKCEYDGLKTLAANGIDCFNLLQEGDSIDNFMPIMQDGVFYGYEFYHKNGSILYLKYGASYAKLDYDIINRTFAISCFMYLAVYSDRIFMTNAVNDFNSIGEPDYQYSSAALGGFVFDLDAGRVYVGE